MYDEMLGNALWTRLLENLVSIGGMWSGLVVGTNLGTASNCRMRPRGEAMDVASLTPFHADCA